MYDHEWRGLSRGFDCFSRAIVSPNNTLLLSSPQARLQASDFASGWFRSVVGDAIVATQTLPFSYLCTLCSVAEEQGTSLIHGLSLQGNYTTERSKRS